MASASYRAGEKLTDDRLGRVFNYSRKQGIEFKKIIFPSGIRELSRAELWNKVEAVETRKNSTTAREYELGLPAELTDEERKDLCLVFSKILTNKYGVAADVVIHQPSKKGDKRNYHAHIMTTTRSINNDGLGEKTRILDDIKTGPDEILKLRHLWAVLVNDKLEKAGFKERVDHRSYKEQELEKIPSVHLGPEVTQLERRGQKQTLETKTERLKKRILKTKASQKH